MRHIVGKSDTYWWADRLLNDALAVSGQRQTRVTPSQLRLRASAARVVMLAPYSLWAEPVRSWLARGDDESAGTLSTAGPAHRSPRARSIVWAILLVCSLSDYRGPLSGTYNS